jgi:hypothetical protein
MTASLSGVTTRAARIICAISSFSLAALVQIPDIARLSHLRDLHPDDWTIAILAGVGTGSLSMLFSSQASEPAHACAPMPHEAL